MSISEQQRSNNNKLGRRGIDWFVIAVYASIGVAEVWSQVFRLFFLFFYFLYYFSRSHSHTHTSTDVCVPNSHVTITFFISNILSRVKEICILSLLSGECFHDLAQCLAPCKTWITLTLAIIFFSCSSCFFASFFHFSLLSTSWVDARCGGCKKYICSWASTDVRSTSTTRNWLATNSFNSHSSCHQSRAYYLVSFSPSWREVWMQEQNRNSPQALALLGHILEALSARFQKNCPI